MPAALHFITGSLRGREIPIPAEGATIGRDAGAGIVIPLEDQRFVSRVHAAILIERGQYVVEDRGSSNGTLVNGARIQRAALNDGDEIQFGRQGPVARLRVDVAPHLARTELPPPARSAVASDSERPSQVVRRVVGEEMNRRARRSRIVFASIVIVLAIAGSAGAWWVVRSGLVEDVDTKFRRLAAEYENRVVLVEVGINLPGGRYVPLANGSGFFAADGGFIVTNKHVVRGYLYSKDTACLAEALRLRGVSFDDALVLSVWRGGAQFRQSPDSESGDRGLGFSTEHRTLALVALSPDNVREVEVGCSDPFGDGTFMLRWRKHEDDNNDLAVLRAISTMPLPSIPLGAGDPPADEPVMVLGFPTGTTPLETNVAAPIRRVGRVLRTQETIQIDAVVLGGNSGGPLIDSGGRVLGITTRGPAETLNMAIKVDFARLLLDRARQVRLD